VDTALVKMDVTSLYTKALQEEEILAVWRTNSPNKAFEERIQNFRSLLRTREKLSGESYLNELQFENIVNGLKTGSKQSLTKAKGPGGRGGGHFL